jgi:hypothetical protein
MEHVKAFVAGLAGVLVFHQIALALLWWAGVAPRPPYNFAPVPPLGVPAVLSGAFWGGVWAVVLRPALAPFRGTPAYWAAWLAAGAVLLTLVGLFLVAPLKGQPVGGGWHASAFLVGAVVNGAWGLGTAALLRLGDRSRLDVTREI